MDLSNVRQEEAVYRGMTAAEVAKAYDAIGSIPDCMGWLKRNAERSQVVEARLKPLKNVAYGRDQIQKLDIYAPDEAENAPVLIDIHGGSWCMGSKNPRAIPAEPVMSHGAVWVSIDYGLAPVYKIDQIIDHIRQAVVWIHQHISEYGGDPNRLYISGNSAGAHLAATALMPGWAKDYGVPEEAIMGAVLKSGVYDMDSQIHAASESQAALQMSWEDSREASPLYHLPERKLPVIIAYGEEEPMGFSLEAQEYGNALKKSGCEVTLIEVKDTNHFDICNEFTNTEGDLFQAVLSMMELN